MGLTVKDFFICDDIRTEVGNKFSLMGLYADRIVITPFNGSHKEFRLPLSAMIRVLATDDLLGSEIVFKIAISFEGNKLADIDGKVDLNNRNIATINLQRFDLQLSHSGTLEHSFKFFIKDNEVLNYANKMTVVVGTLKSDS